MKNESSSVLACMRQDHEYSVPYLSRQLGLPAVETRRLLGELLEQGLVLAASQTSWSIVFRLAPHSEGEDIQGPVVRSGNPATVATSSERRIIGGSELQGYEESLSRHRSLAMLGRRGGR
jgi:DNA-binding IclR family transcriptional regulator